MSPRLIVITDFAGRGEGIFEPLERLVRAAPPKSVLIQLRDHQLSARRRFALGRRLRELTRAHGQLFAVNDRLDLAVLLEADGLHLGDRSVAPEEARRVVGPRCWLSRACHDPGDAALRGADAVVLSPIFAPRHGRPALGVVALAAARAALGTRARLFALGGVDEHNARDALAAGADGLALTGAVLDRDDPTALLGAW